MRPIFTASSKTVAEATAPMPTGNSTLRGWLRSLELVKIVTKVVGSRTIETEVPIEAQGVWQPFTSKELVILPEGQRAWEWILLHVVASVVLEPQEVVSRRGKRYRVMGQKAFIDNGIVEYHLVNDADAQGGGTA